MEIQKQVYESISNVQFVSFYVRKYITLKYTYFKYFDDTLFIICYVYSFKHFTVLSSSKFTNNLIIILLSEIRNNNLYLQLFNFC